MNRWLLAVSLVYPLLVTCKFDHSTFDQFAPIQPGIDWEPCIGLGNDDPHFFCGRFEVPLDWANPRAGKASLAVLRYSAPAPNKLGYLFMNPGGPAHSGLMSSVEGRAKHVSDIAANAYDIISWDTRGTNHTYPYVDCFNSQEDESRFWGDSILETGVQQSYHFTSRSNEMSNFYDMQEDVDKKLHGFAQRCFAKHGNHLKYLGTAAVARDLLAMADHLSPGKPVNLWLFSYATVIAAHFVNMFPNRVGRVITDGLVNPQMWTSEAHLVWGYGIQDSDYALKLFVSDCLKAGPMRCAIADKASDSESLHAWIAGLIDKLYAYHRSPDALPLFKPSQFRAWLIDALSWPAQWPATGRGMILLDIITTPQAYSQHEVQEAIKEAQESHLLQFAIKYDVHAAQAITCGDALEDEPGTVKEVFDEIVRVTQNVTTYMGARWDDPGLFCKNWPVRAVERYRGPWNNTLANRILLLHNMADPYATVKASKWMAEEWNGNAVFVGTQGIGHCSDSTRSACSDKILRDYLLHNILPASGTICPTEFQPFPNPAVQELKLKEIPQWAHSLAWVMQHPIFSVCCLVMLIAGVDIAHMRRSSKTLPLSSVDRKQVPTARMVALNNGIRRFL